MFLTEQVFEISLKCGRVAVSCTIEQLDKLFTYTDTSFDTLDNLFNEPDTSNINKRIKKIIEILQTTKSTQCDGFESYELSENECVQAIAVITKCLQESLPSVEDIPIVKQSESKSKKHKKKQSITLAWVVYVGVTVLSIDLCTVKQMTVKQVIQLYGQHLLYTLGAEEETTLNDLIPL